MTFEEFEKEIKVTQNTNDCPVAKTLLLISGKWTSRVIFELEKYEQARFSELKKNIPDITNAMLSSTLKNLEEQKVIARLQYNEMPVRVEYSLTQKGRDMLPIYFEMAKWGSKYF